MDAQIIAALIGAASGILIALMNKKSGDDNTTLPKGLLVPEGYVHKKVKSSPNRFPVIFLILLFGGATSGYLLGIFFSSMLNLSAANGVAPAITPTKTTQCAITTPYTLKSKGKFVYIIIDDSASYYQFENYASKLIIDILPKIVGPNDRFLVTWLGTSSVDPNRMIFDQTLSIEQIQFISTPALKSTPTPFSNGTTFKSQYATQTAYTINEENQLVLNSYHCELNSHNNSNISIHKNKIMEFTSNIQNALETAENSYNPLSTTNLSEALYVASKILQDKKNYYDDLFLIVFSDMKEVTTYSTGNLPEYTTFEDIHIVVPMLPCPKAQECESIISTWTSTFEQTKAKSIDIKIFGQIDTETLQSIIINPK